MITSALQSLLTIFALPEVGLASVFLVSLISATLIPFGSEPTLFAFIKMNGSLFWPAILIATLGNTLGGIISYWTAYGAKQLFAKERKSRWFGWLERYGAKTMLMAWLPVIGDPICALAGWLKLPFWPCVAYMALGKFLRYLTIVWLLLYVPDGFWREVGTWF